MGWELVLRVLVQDEEGPTVRVQCPYIYGDDTPSRNGHCELAGFDGRAVLGSGCEIGGRQDGVRMHVFRQARLGGEQTKCFADAC